MPLVKGETSIPANATNTNILTGSVFEFAPADALVEFGLVAAATGLQVTVLSGSDVLMEESPISVQNRFPIYPDDYDLYDMVNEGDHIVIRVRNTTGAAIIIFHALRWNPAG